MARRDKICLTLLIVFGTLCILLELGVFSHELVVFKLGLLLVAFGTVLALVLLVAALLQATYWPGAPGARMVKTGLYTLACAVTIILTSRIWSSFSEDLARRVYSCYLPATTLLLIKDHRDLTTKYHERGVIGDAAFDKLRTSSEHRI